MFFWVLVDFLCVLWLARTIQNVKVGGLGYAKLSKCANEFVNMCAWCPVTVVPYRINSSTTLCPPPQP